MKKTVHNEYNIHLHVCVTIPSCTDFLNTNNATQNYKTDKQYPWRQTTCTLLGIV